MNDLLGEAENFFDNRLERHQIVYAIKCFIGVNHVVEDLVPVLVSDDKEKRLSAALMLILLADAKQPVPPGADPESQRVRSASLLLPHGVAFKEGAREALIARPDTSPVSI